VTAGHATARPRGAAITLNRYEINALLGTVSWARCDGCRTGASGIEGP
jgi:hypothetical protein